MKKLIYGISFLALVGITIVGCQRESISPTTKTSGSAISADITSNRIGEIPTQHFYDNSDDDYGCKAPAISCLDEVIITAIQVNGQSVVTAIINNHNTAVDVADNDVVIFLANQDVVNNLFSDQDVLNIINGIATLEIRGNIPSLDAGDKNYYKFYDIDGKMGNVYPIQLD